jgi:N6-adenosine-specific RNA methylase IME4/ParB-like chromosome segregation protein Spo0J
MSELDYHPLANLFPLIEGTDFDDLVSDIKAHGLRESIVVHEGLILDGRNRYRACAAAGVPVRLVPYEGDDALAFVVSLNLRRRHLDEGQRAWVAAKIANMTQGRQPESKGANLPLLPASDAPVSIARAAEMMNVSERTVKNARVVLDRGIAGLQAAVEAGDVSVSAAAEVARAPVVEQVEIVARGEKAILEAAKSIRLAKAEERRTELAEAKAAIPPPVFVGKYGTIVIDPPWDMEKIERDVRPAQVAFEYPTMTEAELAAFSVGELADDAAHLFCWTTQKYLPSALRLVDAWGFRYVLTMVWHKPGGFQPIGLPQYNCEFVVYARKGAPTFCDTKAFPCAFQAPRREHSRKPDEFYDVIRRVTDGHRIDVFSREKRDGFAQFGNEAGKFAA